MKDEKSDKQDMQQTGKQQLRANDEGNYFGKSRESNGTVLSIQRRDASI